MGPMALLLWRYLDQHLSKSQADKRGLINRWLNDYIFSEIIHIFQYLRFLKFINMHVK